MDEELEVEFTWIPLIKRGFLKSFSADYEVGTLELLQQNITEEILKLKLKYDTKRGKLLFQCIEYFYYHFCRKWYQWKRLSVHMEVAWVHILTSFLKIGLLLSQGKKKSKWINRILTAIMRYPGEKNLMYDALLSVNCLNKKYQPVYGSILMYLLIYVSSFVPFIINDPAEYLKLCLLFRRLKFLIKDPAEKSELQMKASKILAPSTLSSWLLAHNYYVTWIGRARRIDLRINVFKKLGGKKCEKEVVQTLRKILLPGICTKRKAKLDRPCSGLNETDQFTIEKNNTANVFENMPLYVVDSFKKGNCVSVSHDHWVLPEDKKTVSETEIKNIKMKNKRNYTNVKSDDEVPSADKYEIELSEMEFNSKNIKRRKSYGSKAHCDLLLLQDEENDIPVTETEIKSKKMKRKKKFVSEDERKQAEMEKSMKKHQQNALLCNNDSEAESKSKKKKHRKVALNVTEKNLEIMDETANEHSPLKHISKTTKSKKTNQKGQNAKELDSNSKEIELITIYQESDSDTLPIIVGEINPSELASYERVHSSEFRKINSAPSCSEDEPFIVTEIKHYPIVGQSSSQSKKIEPIQTLLNSNIETKTVSENVIDAEPSPCITESDTVQDKYNTIYDSEKIIASLCEKSQNINDDKKDLNISVNLTNLQDKNLLSETNSKLKIAEKSSTSEEIEDLCIGKSSPLKNVHSQIFCAGSVSNLIDECHVSDKETNLSSGKQTDINVKNQDCKQDGDNVISPNMEECLGHVNQADEESSRDVTLQNKSLDNSSNRPLDLVENIQEVKSDQTSEKLSDKSKKFPIQVDSKNQTTRDRNISHKDITALELPEFCMSDSFSLAGDSSVQETEMQQNDSASFETDALVSDADKIDFSKTNLINTKTTKNNSEVIEKSELPFENGSLYCLVNKDEVTHEKRASDSLVNPPLSDISVLKVDGTGGNIDSIELKNEVPSEQSISGLLEHKSCVQSLNYPLDTNISSQKIEIIREKLITDISLPHQKDSDSETVLNTSAVDSLEVDNPKVLKDSASIDIQSPSGNDPIHKLSSHQKTRLFSEEKFAILKTEKSQRSVDHHILQENQKLDVKAKSDEVQTPNSSAANRLVENMLNLVERVSYVKNEFGKQNILKGDLSSTINSMSLKFLANTTFLENEISEKCLSFLDISSEKDCSSSEIESLICHASKSPEFLQYRNISMDQDDIRSEDTLSENKSILKAVASGYLSDTSIGVDGEENNSLSECNSCASSSDGVPEASSSKNNDVAQVEKSKLSFKKAIEGQKSCKEHNDESETKESQSVLVDIPKIQMLNPVVNLGERCDSKNFILANSSVSSDSTLMLDIKIEDEEINETRPMESNQPPSTININKINKKLEVNEGSSSNTHETFKERYDEINEGKKDFKVKFQPGQKELCSSPNQEMTISNESEKSVKVTTEKEFLRDQEWTGKDKSQKLPVGGKDQGSVELTSEKELSQDQKGTGNEKNQELSVCDEDQESVELTSEKELSQDQEGTGNEKNQELSVCDEDQESVDPTSEKGQELVEDKKESFMLSLSMKLRKRQALSTQTQKSSLADEDCSSLNQNSLTNSGRSLRSRNPPPSSRQEVTKSRSQTVTKRSSKRLKKEVNMDLDFDLSKLSLNSPKIMRNKPYDPSNKTSSEVEKDNVEAPTTNRGNPCRRSTRASVVPSNVDSKIKDQDTDPEGYNLRSRRPVIMPGKLKF